MTPIEDAHSSPPGETGPAQLSRLLWQARESLEMWADTVEARSRQPDDYTRGIVAEIDAYRAAHGWSAGGYGGEWLCPWCGDYFGPRDDDVPPVCDLCSKAGRGVPAQDAVEPRVSGSGGTTDGRLERMYTQMYIEMVKRCRVQGRIPPHPGDPEAVWALLRQLLGEDAGPSTQDSTAADTPPGVPGAGMIELTDAAVEAAWRSWNGLHVGTAADRLRAALEAALPHLDASAGAVEQRTLRLHQEATQRLRDLRDATATSALRDEVHEEETRLRVLEEVLALEAEPME